MVKDAGPPVNEKLNDFKSVDFNLLEITGIEIISFFVCRRPTKNSLGLRRLALRFFVASANLKRLSNTTTWSLLPPHWRTIYEVTRLEDGCQIGTRLSTRLAAWSPGPTARGPFGPATPFMLSPSFRLFPACWSTWTKAAVKYAHVFDYGDRPPQSPY
jgi:hypothetical protein